MAIFRFFKMADAAILDFLNFKFLRPGRSRGSNCIIVSNFDEIARTAAEIWRFFDFLRWRPSAILDLWYVCWDHPRRAFGGLYHCGKFGWNRCSSFDNMHVFRFREFGLKTPIHAPKLGVSGVFDPLNGEQCEKFPKRHILARVRVVWAIVRENTSTFLTCRWVP